MNRITTLNVFLWVCFLVLLSSFSYAKSAGETSSSFLLIDPSAKSKALAGAQVSVVGRIDASYWNPASLGNLRRKELLFSYLRFLPLENINYGYVAYAHPTRAFGTFGFMTTVLDSGSIEKTNLSGSAIGKFGTQDIAVGPMWGYQLGKYLLLGVGGNYIRQSVDTMAINSFAFDLGFMLTFWKNRLTFGLASKNIGDKIKGHTLPTTVAYGISYRPTLKWLISGQCDYIFSGPIAGRLGVEYSYWEKLSFRIGYKLEKDNLNPFHFGFGLNLTESLAFNYAFAFSGKGLIENSNQISLSYLFGKVLPTKLPREKVVKYSFKESEVVAVLNLKGLGVTEGEASVVSDLLETAVVKKNIFKVVEGKRVETISHEEYEHLEKCDEIQCAIRMGKLLEANKVIIGSLGKLGNIFVLNIKAVDVESGEVKYADQAESSSIENIGESIKDVVQNIARATLGTGEIEKEERTQVNSKIKKIEINRWEIGPSVNWPFPIERPSGWNIKSLGGVAGEFGYNFTNWFQLGTEIGFSAAQFQTDSLVFSKSYTDITVITSRITPRVKLQRYLGRFIQPFMTIGMGYYREQTSLKDSQRSVLVATPGDNGGFGINSALGFNVGEKKDRLKLSIKMRVDKIWNNNFAIGSSISPELCVMFSF